MTYAHKVGWMSGSLSTETPGSAEQLNAASFWKRPSITEMAAIDDSNFVAISNDADIYCMVKSTGLYRWQSGSSYTADGQTVINGTAGQWVQEIGIGTGGEQSQTELKLEMINIQNRLEKLERQRIKSLQLQCIVPDINYLESQTVKIGAPWRSVWITGMSNLSNQKVFLKSWVHAQGILYLSFYNTSTATASGAFAARIDLAYTEELDT